jgi:chromosome segregation ATPase
VTTWSAGDDDLGSVLDKLRNDLDDLMNAVAFLPDRLSGIDGQMEQVRRTVRQLEATANEADRSVKELGALVKRLDARVEWLERNIRLHDPSAVVVELDDVPPDLIRMAEVAESGHVAQSLLMSAELRSGLEAKVDAHAAALHAQTQQLEIAIAASRTLADTPMGDDVHVEAIGEFRDAVTAMDAARRRSKELVRDAVEAAEQLGADDEQRAVHTDVITEGEQAWAYLLARLRARIADAVGEGALLPAWFTTVLGPIPPAQDTRAWMDAATGLLAYRVTYGVTDPIVALGADPGEQHSARRRAWHQQLRRVLRDLQR